MKKTIKFIIAASVFCLSLVGLSNVYVSAEGEETTTSEKTTSEPSIHPDGEEDALSGKIQEIDPDAPPVLIQVSPVSNQVIIESGKTKEYSMTIKNAGSKDFSYHLYATPYSIADELYNAVDFSTETPRTQIARWIKFYQDGKLVDRPKFTIKSGETQLIKYVVETPADIPAGGQYAAIFAETETGDGVGEDSLPADTSGIRTASRVGMVVYGRTNGETTELGEITDFNIQGFITDSNIVATAKVHNGGNTDFESSFTMKISSILGAELYNKTSSYTILPETDRRVNLEWSETPFMGMFKVSFKVEVPGENGEKITREEEKLVVKFPILMIILTILVLTGLIIGIIMYVRKRRERNARLAV